MIIYQNASLTLFQSGLYQTNSVLFHKSNTALLVDPNWLPNEVQFIRDYLTAHHADQSLYLLFTHSDYDHILGYGLFPEAKVIASQAFQENIRKSEILEEIRDFDQKHYLQRDYALSYPEVDFCISTDGERLILDDFSLSFYQAPGHTADGLFTIIEEEGVFLAGDYLSDLEFPFVYYSSSDYLQTLDKTDLILQKHPIHLLIPGHGAIVKNDYNEILSRKNRDQAYLTELISSIQNGIDFPLADWLKRFPFPQGLKDEHKKNQQHIMMELGYQSGGND